MCLLKCCKLFSIFTISSSFNFKSFVLAKNEYSYCIAVIESDQRQVREKLAEAQENVNSFATQSEQRIDQCQRIYNIRGNVSQLQTCVAASLIRIKQISFILDNSLQSLPNSLFVNNLANCVENTITTAKKALNSNYDVIQKCFATSGAPLAEKAADIILLVIIILFLFYCLKCSDILMNWFCVAG